MNPAWNIIAPLLSLAIVMAVTQLAVIVADAFRTWDYRSFENRSAAQIENEFPLPTQASSAAEEHRRYFAPMVDQMHRAANKAQNAYHATVVRSATCLALGFAATAGGMLTAEDWPMIFRFQTPSWQLVLNWIDAISLVLVFVFFVRGSSLYRPWINRRAVAELVRQYQFLSVLFPAMFPAAEGPELPAVGPALANENDRRSGNLVSRIEQSWHERKSRIEQMSVQQMHVSRDALILYLKKRVLRQLGWFTDSIARLERIAMRRKNLLFGLYIVTTLLGLLQLGCYLAGIPLLLVRPILLLITGLSLAMTAYYTNQNLRSIVHRYNVQQRDIRHWLGSLVLRLNDGNTPHLLDDRATTKLICEHIAAFEELMIYELIDWINISGHDVIELG